ncbi:hypothetical protein HPT25_22535 [Bacillus sp. BRMEA1]|uniref:hypothetical protein n=1 Tax=Neobacillus endophyticus TaxID=2738405 RepID=UPI001563F30C|nr:hypothetical protein [Neobacillus endophyticus]NRD80120.1 hypothetical protein [Neobacillus endophyticus]
MKKTLLFFITIVILLLLNFGAARLLHASLIDLSFPIGLLGLLITMPNNPMTMFFNSKITISAGDMYGKRPGHEKFGKIPVLASFLYTLAALIVTFLTYKKYFM